MKVYIVMVSWHWEGEQIKGVYSKKEDAEYAVVKLLLTDTYDSVRIKEMEVE